MNKYRIPLLLALIGLSIAAIVWRPCGKSCTASSSTQAGKQEEKGGPQNPGWFEQYFRMKKNEQGVIPRDVWRHIMEQRVANAGKTAATGLSNIAVLGPDNIGGRTRTLVVDASDHSRLLAAGVSGGIWESTNSGLTWAPLTDNLTTLAFTSIAQNPMDNNIWLGCTGEPRGNSAGISGFGLYKSTDNGNTWAMIPGTDVAAFDQTWDVVWHPSNAAVAYVGTRDYGLYQTTDGGTTFNQVFDLGGSDVTDILTYSDNSVLAGVRGKGIYKSPSGASGTFTRINSGLPANGFRRIEIEKCTGTPNIVYAAMEDSTSSSYYTQIKDIWKSTDSGNTWTDVSNPDLDYGITFYFPWYALLLAVDPTDPNFLMVGSVSLAVSADGGSTWSEADYSHADYHTAVFNPDIPRHVYVGNDGGVYQYNLTFLPGVITDLNNSYHVGQYYTGHYWPSGLNMMGGTQDNGTHGYQLGVGNANPIFGGDGSGCAVNQQNDNISYVSYQYGQIHRADDSYLAYPGYYDILYGSGMDADFDGSVDDGCWFINPFEIHNGDGDQLYFVTYSRIFRTTDGGGTWEPLTNDVSPSDDDSPYCVGIAHQESNPTVYIGGEGGTFLRVDGAATASPGSEVDLGASVPVTVATSFIGCIKVHPVNSGTAYLSMSNFSTQPRVWKVTNANTASPTWTNISGDLPTELPVNWIEAHPDSPDDYLIAATDDGLYVTQNGGTTWEKETTIPNVAIHMIRVRASDNKLIIPTHGRGFWTADLPPFVGTEKPIASGKPLTVYPNPVRDELFFTLPGSSKHGDWVIHDTRGSQIMAGEGTVTGVNQVDVSALPAGIYMLTAGKQTVKIFRQ